MSIKIGDKVRFLNDVGGGVVVGFNGLDEVIVEDDSGFGFPHSRRECVVIPAQTPPKSISISKHHSTVEESSKSPGSPNQYQVLLAFAPSDVENLGTGSVKLYLINNSDYTLSLNIASSQNAEQCDNLKSATVRPYEILPIVEVSRAKLRQLENLLVQIIATKPFGTYTPQEPINRNLNTRLVKFSKRSSFSLSPQLGCDALTVDLTSPNVSPKDIADYTIKVTLPPAKPLLKGSLRQRRDIPTTPEVVEVDLHIENLLDTTAGMSNGDILEFQLDHLRSTISQYSRYRGLKLVFIHGKGDGVLRRSIIEELKRMGRGDRYQEASFKKYGSGALMVVM